MHILLVEDDPQLGDAIRRALERLAHTISWHRDGAEALAALRGPAVDLVLLDLGLPGMDGMEVLTEARRLHIDTPVIVMSARDQLDARIQVLDAGADDYLVKPFHLDELAARIRSLSRRVRGAAVNRLDSGALSLDLATFEVTWRGDKLDLTRREFALLQVLMERTGHIVRREVLENTLYGPDSGISSGALEVLVHSLRRKVSHEAIQTVRGFGYMLAREPL